MLTLAFDTATPRATCALVRGDEVLGEAETTAVAVLAAADELLRAAELEPSALERIVVGTGPGSFTGIRIGIAAARGLALARGLPLAGVSTLAALAAGAPGAVPVIDARRREVFTLVEGEPVVLAPAELDVKKGSTLVGDGAARYRALFEERGAQMPPDASELHLPRARFHAALAGEAAGSAAVEPIYIRIPDAEQARLPVGAS